MAAEYPTTITEQLYEVVSRLATTLTADINDLVTTIPVASTAGFPAKGFVVIGNETIYYGSLGVNSLTTCTRGFSGTAAAHLQDSQVKAAIVAEHFNRFRVELIATQTKIGISGSTYTTTLDYKATQGLAKGTEALNYLYGTSSLPAFIVTPSSAPTTNYQVANKKYVDEEVDEESTITTTIASSATPTPARASRKTMYVITALTETATFGAPTGTPKLGDALLIWAKSSAAAERTLNWNTIYKDGSTKRPTKTLASTTKYVKILYIFDGTDWRCDFEGSDI